MSSNSASSARKQTRLRRLRNQINPLVRRTYNYFYGQQASGIMNREQMSSNSTSAAAEPMLSNAYSATERAVPKNVTRVIVHESVTVIPKYAFQGCHDLKEVVLPEGLTEIRYGAFRGCTSLEDINCPSTLRVIDGGAFEDCSSLVRVDFNEGLQTIDFRAFAFCQSIVHLKVPSTVAIISTAAFQDCSALKDVQLCEGLWMIQDCAFACCYSLLHINIPSSATTIEKNAFGNCNFLRNVAIAPDFTLGQWVQEAFEESRLLRNLREVDCSLDSVKIRFDGLPLHRICFFQTENATCLEEVKEHVTKERLTQLDCLGMTPLHILACTARHNIGLYKLFVGIYPEALLIKDKWQEAPLAYVILSEAPQEIIHFLFENHSNILNGSLPFDFSTMVEKLVKKKGTSAEFVKSIIQAQRTHFPSLDIEWERIVNENMEGRMHTKVFRVLVEASISKRSNCMSLEHQLTIDNLINDIHAHINKTIEGQRVRGDGQKIINCIQDYAHQYREFLKEAATMLELALWKFAIDELEIGQGSNEEGNHDTYGAEFINAESRRQCRFKCNTEDIFPVILSFL